MVQTVVQKYLVLRGNVYHFRYALPQDIRQVYPHLPREIKRSLQTDSLSEASALVADKLVVIQAVKNYHNSLETRLSLIESLSFERKNKLPAHSHTKKFRLSVAWVKFCSWKTWPDKQAKANQRLFENLMLFVGDRYVEEISKQTLKEALISIQKLPKRNKSPYKSIPLKQLSRMKIPEEDRVSSKYVKEHLKLCQSLFGRYLRDELDVIDKSPTEGLVYDYQQSRFAALTDMQVLTLIPSLGLKPEWFKWLFLLALYTGARRSELMKLTKADFKLCPVSERPYFEINSGKTRAARRQVALGEELQSYGFMSWLEIQPKGPLFKVTINRATDLFNSMVEVKRNFHGERIVFHSLRHTFITKARAAGIQDVLVQQVVGHEKRGAGQTDRYTHNFNLEDTFKVVDSVSFNTKVLP